MSVRVYPTPSRVLYQQTWDASGTNSWASGGNASGVTTAALDAGYPSVGAHSLTWTATAAGTSTVSSAFIAVPASTDLMMSGRLVLGGSGTYSARMHVDWYDTTGSTYLNGFYDWTRSGLTGDGVTFYYLAAAAYIPSNGGYVQVSVDVFSATAAQQFWLDNVIVTT